MKNHFLVSLLVSAAGGLGGCGSGDARKPDDTAINSSVVAAQALDTRPKKTVRQSERLLGPDERRVVVFVVPGDALVEVDGERVDRRSGVVELIGKVGDVRRLRAWKGDKSTETKEISIGASGATPSFVDVYEVKPGAKNVVTKPKAARFDDE